MEFNARQQGSSVLIWLILSFYRNCSYILAFSRYLADKFAIYKLAILRSGMVVKDIKSRCGPWVKGMRNQICGNFSFSYFIIHACVSNIVLLVNRQIIDICLSKMIYLNLNQPTKILLCAPELTCKNSLPRFLLQ